MKGPGDFDTQGGAKRDHEQAPQARLSLPRYQSSQSLTQKDVLLLGAAAPFSSAAGLCSL